MQLPETTIANQSLLKMAFRKANQVEVFSAGLSSEVFSEVSSMGDRVRAVYVMSAGTQSVLAVPSGKDAERDASLTRATPCAQTPQPVRLRASPLDPGIRKAG